MQGIINFIVESGFVGWCIIMLGVASTALIVERSYSLYYKLSFKSDDFFTKIQNLVLGRKFDEALVYANQHPDKPLAQAFKTVLEKSDRDDNGIFQAHDIAMSEQVPKITQRLHYLSMLANVATLMGLLGTIHGLILSFEAVAQADPSMKQALLAKGISVSMYTTALGLAVAIPAMIFFSFLVSKQNALVDELTEKCGKLTEMLTGSHLPSLNKETMYPSDLKRDEVAKKSPPTAVKAS